MRKRFNVDVRTKQEVTAIDRENKQVTVKNHQSGEIYEESYDYLLLSPGAEPVKPPLAGIEGENIFTLRNIPDTDRIKEFVEHKKPESMVVVGGGFIGLEMAENLTEAGIEVSIVEMADQVMPPLDYDMAVHVHSALVKRGVKLYLGDGLAAISGKDGKKGS